LDPSWQQSEKYDQGIQTLRITNLTDTGVSGTRADRMKAAMRLLLDQASSFNVGLASFQGADRGASIRYPIGWLESSTESFCGDEKCPDELVTARPVSEQDTAVQNDDTLLCKPPTSPSRVPTLPTRQGR